MRLCAHLRWPGYYGARWETREAMIADVLGATAPYSCARSCQPFGPDDDVAAPERCDPDRSCFAPSPLEPTGPRPVS